MFKNELDIKHKQDHKNVHQVNWKLGNLFQIPLHPCFLQSLGDGATDCICAQANKNCRHTSGYKWETAHSNPQLAQL